MFLNALRATAVRIRTAIWTTGLLAVVAGWSGLLLLLLFQYSIYGYGRLLGWDSVNYVYLETVVLREGPLAAALYFQYPHLYVQLLAGTAFAFGNPFLAEEILPPAIALCLVVAYYKIGGALELDIVALVAVPVVAGISIEVVRLEADLNRTLLAIAICWVVVDSVRRSGKLFGRRPRDILVCAAVLCIAFIEFETFAILAASLFVYSVWTRRWTLLLEDFALGLVASGFLLLFFPAFFLGYAGTTTLIPSTGLNIDWGEVLDFGFGGILLIPVFVLGLVGFARRNPATPTAQETQRLVLSWIVVCYGVFLLLAVGVIRLPAIRALYLVPTPVVLGMGLSEVQALLKRQEGPAISEPEASHEPRTHLGLPVSTKVLSLALVLFLVAATFTVTWTRKDYYLNTFIPDSAYKKIVLAGQILRAEGVSTVLILALGFPAVWYWNLYEPYFRVEVGDPVFVYGSLHYILNNVDPSQYESFPLIPNLEQIAANSTFDEASHALESRGLVFADLPILLISPEVYNGTELSQVSNLSSYEKAPGIYLLPRGTLDGTWARTWVFRASSDWTTQDGFYTAPRNWSVSGSVLEAVNLTENSSATVTFNFYTASPENLTLDLHLMDYAERWNSSYPLYAPIGVYLDGREVLVHDYQGQGPIWIAAQVPQVGNGPHVIRISTGEPGRNIILSLDEVQVAPG